MDVDGDVLMMDSGASVHHVAGLRAQLAERLSGPGLAQVRVALSGALLGSPSYFFLGLFYLTCS